MGKENPRFYKIMQDYKAKLQGIFPVGSTVVFLGDEEMNAKEGATATVIGLNKKTYGHGYYLEVKWDRNDLSMSQDDGNYDPNLFELVG